MTDNLIITLETCENCKYFFMNGPDANCRRYPPSLWIGRGNLGQEQLTGSFPPVDKAWTCGEFKMNALMEKAHA